MFRSIVTTSVVLGSLAVAVAAQDEKKPRPISAVERHALTLAVLYLEQGAAGWWDELAPNAPLREFERQAAIDEIAVRCGPLRDSTWTLLSSPGADDAVVFSIEFPSGVDEILSLVFTPDDGAKLVEVRSLVDARRGQSNVLALASLAGLREQLARGASTAGYEVPPGRLGGAVQLWLAQHHLVQRRLSEATRALEAGRAGLSDAPLVPLLEARLAVLESRAADARTAYQDAFAQLDDHDGLRLEAGYGLGWTGLLFDADEHFAEAARQGTRLAEVYYSLARLAVVQWDVGAATRHFETAWELRPLERSQIFADTALAYVAAQPDVLPRLEISSPSEPVIALPGRRRPLAVLARHRTRVLGHELTAEVADGRLVVPGGARLAPLSAERDDAARVARRREAEALAALDGADGVTRSISPEQLETASQALSRGHRWHDVLRITDAYGERPELLSPGLAQLRALALFETERIAEARKLLIRIAQDDATNRRRDPTTFLQLSELMAANQHYDLAIRLVERARALLPYDFGDARVRQLEMEKRLASSFQTFRTEHFDIRYPASTGVRYASDVGLVLEQELRRLRKWIPVPDDVRIGIDLFPILEFMGIYSQGVLVLGLYDGRVRLPFAELRSLHPEIVKVLSHEVAHAMIAEYTDDRSPKWLHEGLAQHVEMGQREANPIPELDKVGRVLAFPLIEAALQGFGEPQLVELAYRESVWVLHFVEARYGVDGIHRLLDAFRRGHDTDAALRRAFGTSAADFERAAWQWCLTDAPAVWPSELRRYDEELPSAFRRPTQLPPANTADEAARTPAKPLVRWSVPPPKSDPLREPMIAWHSRYAVRVEPIKKALVPVVRGFREPGSQGQELVEACRRLSALLTELLADTAVFATPDRGATTGRRLRLAYTRFWRMSRACEEGRSGDVRGQLKMAEENLGQAAVRLSKYELKP